MLPSATRSFAAVVASLLLVHGGAPVRAMVPAAVASGGAAPLVMDGNLILATKADVQTALDAVSLHAATNAGSSNVVVKGMLRVEGSELTDEDLAPLVSLVSSVAGPVIVTGTTKVATLDWLSNLRKVQGSFLLRGNAKLSNGCALKQLARADVARIISVRDNANAISLPAHLLPTTSSARPTAFPCGGENGDVAVPAPLLQQQRGRKETDAGSTPSYLCPVTGPARDDGATVVYFVERSPEDQAAGTFSNLPEGVSLIAAADEKTGGEGSNTGEPTEPTATDADVPLGDDASSKDQIALCLGMADPEGCNDVEKCGTIQYNINITDYCPNLCDSCKTTVEVETSSDSSSSSGGGGGGAVAGGVVGALVVIGALIAAVIFVQKKKNDPSSDTSTTVIVNEGFQKEGGTSFDAESSGLYDDLAAAPNAEYATPIDPVAAQKAQLDVDGYVVDGSANGDAGRVAVNSTYDSVGPSGGSDPVDPARAAENPAYDSSVPSGGAVMEGADAYDFLPGGGPEPPDDSYDIVAASLTAATAADDGAQEAAYDDFGDMDL